MSEAGGIAERPAPDPEILAVIAAAAEQLLRPSVVAEVPAGQSPWRFSGRWFSAHQVRRRPRPF